MEQAFGFVRQVDHPAVTLNFDVGAIHMAGAFSRVADYLATMMPVVSHVHVSQPQLAPAPADPAEARVLLTALAAHAYPHWVSIEMRAVAGQEVEAVAAALGRLQEARA